MEHFCEDIVDAVQWNAFTMSFTKEIKGRILISTRLSNLSQEFCLPWDLRDRENITRYRIIYYWVIFGWGCGGGCVLFESAGVGAMVDSILSKMKPLGTDVDINTKHTPLPTLLAY
jgi:hypothetical protein